MVVKAINDSVIPNGLISTLLVFEELAGLGFSTKRPTPSTLKRALALYKAASRMLRYFSTRQVRNALSTRNGPDVPNIHNTPTGTAVLVYGPEMKYVERALVSFGHSR